MNNFTGEPMWGGPGEMPGPDEHGIYPNFMEWALKSKKPYSYEPFYVYKDGSVEAEHSVYSDRMMQWDSKKYQRIAEKLFKKLGGNFRDNPNLVQRFLQEYNDDPTITLVAIIEYCNVSNGYPVWRLDYRKD